MKKLLGIVVLGLLWCNISFSADLKKNWNKYVNAYYEGHSECRNEWSSIGNFSSNPKILMDIELCALDADAAALATYGWGPDFDAMVALIDKKHAEVFNAAKEASLDIVQFGNVEANLKRFLKKREVILKRYHNIQKALAFR